MRTGRESTLSSLTIAGALALLIAGPLSAAGGDLLWEDLEDPIGGYDQAEAVVVERGRVLATGWVEESATAHDLITRAYEPETGALLWEDRFDGSGGDDEGWAIAAGSGRVVVAGRTCDGATGNCDFLVRAHQADSGALLWQDQVDYAGDDDIAFAVDVHGPAVVVVGDATAAAGDVDFWVRAYHLMTGALLWEDRLDSNGSDDAARGVGIRGRQVVVVGTAGADATCDNDQPNPLDCDFLVRTYDTRHGTLLWEDRVDAAGGYDFALDVAIQGEFAVVGGFVGADASCTIGPVGDCDLLVRAYWIKSGVLRWSTRTDNQSGTDFAASIAVKGDTVAIAGAGGEGDTDFLTAGYDAIGGALLWQHLVDGGDDDNDLALGVAISGDTAYSAGVLWDGHGDFAVRAYDLRTGVLRWSDRDGRPDGEFALDIDANNGVVSAAGSLTNGGAGDLDYGVRTHDTSP